MSQNILAEDGERYSYFPGCTSHSTAVEYDLSTRAVLKAFGVELVEIEEIAVGRQLSIV
jgi:hypothetical protein